MGEAKVRYAVVGQGYIAQVAVLPSFTHASKNSELAALVSDDPVKLKQLSRRYKVKQTYSYKEYDRCLRSGAVDAVYIALPNNLHCEYTVRAAQAGVHVLCEKPMAVTEAECERMIRATKEHKVRLMIAYRLHFEETNLKAVEIVQSGKLGDPRLFNSVFTMQVAKNNIRLKRDLGGGTLYDIGIYCINAARYLFQAEPMEVSAFTVSSRDKRFNEVDEMTGALLRFPQERVATFTASFGAADVSAYEVVGTKGHLRVDPAYEYVGELNHQLTINGKSQHRTFGARDQFAPELLYFSNCILKGRDPEPSGVEGLHDVAIIRALYHSAEKGKPIRLGQMGRVRRPTVEQEIRRPPIRKPHLVRATSPSGG